MILIVNFYQTPAIWLLGHFGKSDRSPSDLVLALGLAERIRDLVTKSAPGLVPPRKQVGAVRVMTCHESKDLEFPCVAVAGQSLPDIRGPKPSLLPALRANPDLDTLELQIF